MASRLSDVLTTAGIPQGCSVACIHEDNCDASFLIHNCIATELKNGRLVCVLAMNQTFSHYQSVAQKLSTNLRQFITDGTLIFQEALKCLRNNHTLKRDASDDNIFEDLLQGKSMQNVFKKLKKNLEKAICLNPSPLMLIVDHIEVFMQLGISQTEVISFVHYTKMWLTQLSGGSKDNKLIILLENNQGTNVEGDTVLMAIQHYSSHILHVTDLKTGYCKDVTGQSILFRCPFKEETTKMMYHLPTTRDPSLPTSKYLTEALFASPWEPLPQFYSQIYVN